MDDLMELSDIEQIYRPSDIVWVKISSMWWPAEVKDQATLDPEVTEGLKKPPLCVVQFLLEDSYLHIKSFDQIYHYACKRKMEFIKLGFKKYAQHKAEKNMAIYPQVIEEAERRTGGDPDIINDPSIVPLLEKGEDSPVQLPRRDRKRSMNDSSGLNMDLMNSQSSFPFSPRYITHAWIHSTPPIEEDEEKKKNTNMTYSCFLNSCSFATTNRVFFEYHIRDTHRLADYLAQRHEATLATTPGPLKTTPGSHKSAPGSHKTAPGSHKSTPGPSKTTPGPSKSTPGSSKQKKERKRKVEAATPVVKKKKKKKSVGFDASTPAPNVEKKKLPPSTLDVSVECEELLKDWDDDEEDSLEGKKELKDDKASLPLDPIASENGATQGDAIDNSTTEMIGKSSTDAGGSSNKVEAPTKSPSCFDFDDEESIEPDLLNLKFGQKLPRLISPEKSKSALISDSLSEEHTLDSFLNDVAVPEIPSLPTVKTDSLKFSRPNKSESSAVEEEHTSIEDAENESLQASEEHFLALGPLQSQAPVVPGHTEGTDCGSGSNKNVENEEKPFSEEKLLSTSVLEQSSNTVTTLELDKQSLIDTLTYSPSSVDTNKETTEKEKVDDRSRLSRSISKKSKNKYKHQSKTDSPKELPTSSPVKTGDSPETKTSKSKKSSKSRSSKGATDHKHKSSHRASTVLDDDGCKKEEPKTPDLPLPIKKKKHSSKMAKSVTESEKTSPLPKSNRSKSKSPNDTAKKNEKIFSKDTHKSKNNLKKVLPEVDRSPEVVAASTKTPSKSSESHKKRADRSPSLHSLSSSSRANESQAAPDKISFLGASDLIPSRRKQSREKDGKSSSKKSMNNFLKSPAKSEQKHHHNQDTNKTPVKSSSGKKDKPVLDFKEERSSRRSKKSRRSSSQSKQESPDKKNRTEEVSKIDVFLPSSPLKLQIEPATLEVEKDSPHPAGSTLELDNEVRAPSSKKSKRRSSQTKKESSAKKSKTDEISTTDVDLPSSPLKIQIEPAALEVEKDSPQPAESALELNNEVATPSSKKSKRRSSRTKKESSAKKSKTDEISTTDVVLPSSPIKIQIEPAGLEVGKDLFSKPTESAIDSTVVPNEDFTSEPNDVVHTPLSSIDTLKVSAEGRKIDNNVSTFPDENKCETASRLETQPQSDELETRQDELPSPKKGDLMSPLKIPITQKESIPQPNEVFPLAEVQLTSSSIDSINHHLEVESQSPKREKLLSESEGGRLELNLPKQSESESSTKTTELKPVSPVKVPDVLDAPKVVVDLGLTLNDESVASKAPAVGEEIAEISTAPARASRWDNPYPLKKGERASTPTQLLASSPTKSSSPGNKVKVEIKSGLKGVFKYPSSGVKSDQREFTASPVRPIISESSNQTFEDELSALRAEILSYSEGEKIPGSPLKFGQVEPEVESNSENILGFEAKTSKTDIPEGSHFSEEVIEGVKKVEQIKNSSEQSSVDVNSLGLEIDLASIPLPQSENGKIETEKSSPPKETKVVPGLSEAALLASLLKDDDFSSDDVGTSPLMTVKAQRDVFAIPAVPQSPADEVKHLSPVKFSLPNKPQSNSSSISKEIRYPKVPRTVPKLRPVSSSLEGNSSPSIPVPKPSVEVVSNVITFPALKTPESMTALGSSSKDNSNVSSLNPTGVRVLSSQFIGNTEPSMGLVGGIDSLKDLDINSIPFVIEEDLMKEGLLAYPTDGTSLNAPLISNFVHNNVPINAECITVPPQGVTCLDNVPTTSSSITESEAASEYIEEVVVQEEVVTSEPVEVSAQDNFPTTSQLQVPPSYQSDVASTREVGATAVTNARDENVIVTSTGRRIYRARRCRQIFIDIFDVDDPEFETLCALPSARINNKSIENFLSQPPPDISAYTSSSNLTNVGVNTAKDPSNESREPTHEVKIPTNEESVSTDEVRASTAGTEVSTNEARASTDGAEVSSNEVRGTTDEIETPVKEVKGSTNELEVFPPGSVVAVAGSGNRPTYYVSMNTPTGVKLCHAVMQNKPGVKNPVDDKLKTQITLAQQTATTRPKAVVGKTNYVVAIKKDPATGKSLISKGIPASLHSTTPKAESKSSLANIITQATLQPKPQVQQMARSSLTIPAKLVKAVPNVSAARARNPSRPPPNRSIIIQQPVRSKIDSTDSRVAGSRTATPLLMSQNNALRTATSSSDKIVIVESRAPQKKSFSAAAVSRGQDILAKALAITDIQPSDSMPTAEMCDVNYIDFSGQFAQSRPATIQFDSLDAASTPSTSATVNR